MTDTKLDATESAFQNMVAAVKLIAGENAFTVELKFSSMRLYADTPLTWFVWVADVGNASGADGGIVLKKIKAQLAALTAIDCEAEPEATGIRRRA